jgi:hypothetical protein
MHDPTPDPEAEKPKPLTDMIRESGKGPPEETYSEPRKPMSLSELKGEGESEIGDYDPRRDSTAKVDPNEKLDEVLAASEITDDDDEFESRPYACRNPGCQLLDVVLAVPVTRVPVSVVGESPFDPETDVETTTVRVQETYVCNACNSFLTPVLELPPRLVDEDVPDRRTKEPSKIRQKREPGQFAFNG